MPPPKVPKLLPVLKRSNSTQETSEPVVPPAIPKLLPVLKRSHSSQGVTEPVAASPPPIKVKQEKPESPMDFSPCQESMQKVCGQLNMKLLVFVFHCLTNQIEYRINCGCSEWLNKCFYRKEKGRKAWLLWQKGIFLFGNCSNLIGTVSIQRGHILLLCYSDYIQLRKSFYMCLGRGEGCFYVIMTGLPSMQRVHSPITRG